MRAEERGVTVVSARRDQDYSVSPEASGWGARTSRAGVGVRVGVRVNHG